METVKHTELRGVDRRGTPKEAACQFLTRSHPHAPNVTPRFMFCNEISRDNQPLERSSEFVGAIVNGTWAEVEPRKLADKLNHFAHARNIQELVEAKLMAFGETVVGPEDEIVKLQARLDAALAALEPFKTNSYYTKSFDAEAKITMTVKASDLTSVNEVIETCKKP